jgi:hypothetical protein
MLDHLGNINFEGNYDYQPIDLKFFAKLDLDLSHLNLTDFYLVVRAKDRGFFEVYFKSNFREIRELFSSKKGLLNGLDELRDILKGKDFKNKTFKPINLVGSIHCHA